MVDGVRGLGPRRRADRGELPALRAFEQPSAVWRALLDRGVLVRDVSTGPGLAGWLRVNAGTESETTSFLNALREVVTP
jgi:histidinol-phosphate aminotransferase